MNCIPEEFYSSEHERPVVKTVAELKEQLARLPDDLRVECGFGHPELVVYNHGESDMHLGFREAEEDDRD